MLRPSPAAATPASSPLAALATVVALLASPATAPAAERHALALYHFNVQYVAGGLEDFVADQGLGDLWSGLDYTDEGVQDAIIRESFLPLLQLYAEHPSWGADFELQGYMVDVIRERHADVLALMRQLDGQLAFDSFHYADELWTAQPAAAIRRSRQETEAAFAAAGLQVGRAVFTQEGQFGMGMGAALGAEAAATTTLLIPRNLYGLHYADSTRRPLYDMRGWRVMIGGHSFSEPVGGTTFDVTWTFLNDGELAATGEMTPYLLPAFRADPEAVAEIEAGLQALEDAGWTVDTVERTVDAMRAAGIEAEEMPAVVDGAWQPDDTNNLGLWMGDTGIWPESEADNAVRSAWARAYRDVRAAELLGDLGIGPGAGAGAAPGRGAAEPGGTVPDDPPGDDDDDGESAADEALAPAWRELLLGGVSDASGWNPYRSEVAYGFEHQVAARRIAAAWLDAARTPCDCAYRLRGDTGDLEIVERDFVRRRSLDPVDVPWDPGVAAFADDSELVVSVGFFDDVSLDDSGSTLGVHVRFQGAATAADPSRWVEIPWNGNVETLRFLPAGQTSWLAEVPLSVFADEQEPVGVPLANGLLDLGGDRWLVLDPQSMNLAARVHPSQDFVAFADHSRSLSDDESWDFFVVEGELAARALAARLVQVPDAWLLPPPAEERGRGCGGAGRARPLGEAALAGIALLLLPRIRSRQRRRPARASAWPGRASGQADRR